MRLRVLVKEAAVPTTARRKLRPQPRTPQQARSRRTREEILQAAVACFEARGYDETTTAAIARKAGIAVGTLYGYFHDKRAILLELLDGTTKTIGDYVVQNLDPELWREADPRESVRKLIDALFHTRTINPGMQRILWERYFKDDQFRDAVEAISQRVRDALVVLFESLRADGRLRVADLPIAAFLVHAAIEWTASRLMLGGVEAEIDPAVAAASDMVSRFLFKD